MSTVAVEISAARRWSRADLVLVCEESVSWTLDTSFGIPRCKKEGFVVGDWIRLSERPCECRRAERRAPSEGRREGSDDHCGEDSRRVWIGVREERRAERRRMSSRSSGGRDWLADGFGLCLDRAFVVVARVSGFRSRELSALRISCVLAARRRAVLSAWSYDISEELRHKEGFHRTSDTASRSFCAACFFVDPDGFRILFASIVCRAANLGLLCSMDSSIGGSILRMDLFVDIVDVW